MGFPSFTEILTGLSMQAVVRGAQAVPTVADAIDSTSGVGRIPIEVFDAVSGMDTIGWAHDRVARDRGEAGRVELESSYGIAATDFTGDFEPPSVSQMDCFDAMSHAEIVEVVEAMQPARMQESVAGWGRAQILLDDNVEVFRGAIAAVFAEHWTGTTASAAGRGVADYSTSLTQLTRALALVTNSLDYARVGIEQVKQRLPEPPQFTWSDGLRIGFSVAPTAVAPGNLVGRVRSLLHEEEEARATAVRIMKEDYEPTVTTSDARVPVLPPAFDPTTGDNAAASGYPGTGSGRGSSAAGRENGSGLDGSPASLTAYGSGDGVGASGDPDTSRAGVPGSGDAGAPSDSGSPGSQSSGADGSGSARTTAASTDPGSAAPASATVRPGSTPPGSGSAFGGGSGAGSSGVGSQGPGAAGAIPPGFAPGTAAAAPAGAAPGAARGVGRATPMPMGMMPPGARPGDDEKRTVPGYLLTEEHGNELIGDMPATTPPVLGA